MLTLRTQARQLDPVDIACQLYPSYLAKR